MNDEEIGSTDRRRCLLGGGLAVAGVALFGGAGTAEARPAAASLETARVLDERAIEKLLVRYASAVDEHDLKGFEEVFVPDVTS